MKTSIPWLRVLAEGVVIVVSILLAFGIDAWREGRQERALEQTLLDQLITDLARAEEQLSGQVRLTENAGQAALNLLEAARGEREATTDSIAGWLIRVSWWSDPYPTTATAQALVSSNELHVLSSDALRSAVVLFLDEVRQLELRVPRHEEELTRWMGEIDEMEDPLARGTRPFVGLLGGGGPEAQVVRAQDEGAITADLQQLLREDGFQLAAHGAFWAHENLRWLQQSMVDATRSLREEVERARADQGS